MKRVTPCVLQWHQLPDELKAQWRAEADKEQQEHVRAAMVGPGKVIQYSCSWLDCNFRLVVPDPLIGFKENGAQALLEHVRLEHLPRKIVLFFS